MKSFILFALSIVFLCVLPMGAYAQGTAVASIGIADLLTLVSHFPWYEKAITYFVLFSSIVGVFSKIAALTPTPKDDNVARKLVKVVDVLGANIGHAKNKER